MEHIVEARGVSVETTVKHAKHDEQEQQEIDWTAKQLEKRRRLRDSDRAD